MRILITGGAGYIGSHTAKELARQGHEPVVYDNLSTGHRDFVRWGPFEHGDIRDYAGLSACLRRHRPDGVIHFAAKAAVGESVENPGKYYSNNVTGTLALLEAMRDAGVMNIVVSGTCAIFGQPEVAAIDEDLEKNPINPYGESKWFMEKMLAAFERAHGMKWTSLRYFNAAGCDPDAEIGELHDPETHLIPLALAAAAGKRPELVVFGSDLATPDGTCVRDYVHVTDLAEAHLGAMRRLMSGGASGAFNLGTGSGCSVLEIIRAVDRATGKKTPFRLGPPRAGDPLFLVADNRRATEALAWKPRYADIDSIVKTAWRWFEKTMHS